METIVRTDTTSRLSIGDEVWIATALLHREHPTRPDFSTQEIVQRLQEENISGELRAGVYPHVQVFCVATRPAQPARLRMLTETRPQYRRLFRRGDPFHPDREGPQSRRGVRTVPAVQDLPARYRSLLDWYYTSFSPPVADAHEEDPILGLRGLGKHLWSDEHPDAFVARLRQGWQ